MPNPKIPFQYGSQKIIPEVKDTAGRRVQHEPEQLLQHITLQIVSNFVLHLALSAALIAQESILR